MAFNQILKLTNPNRSIIAPFIRNIYKSSIILNTQKTSYEYGLNKFQRRSLRRRLNKGHTTMKIENHMYKRYNQFDNKWDLADHLKSNEIYKKGGLIAVNKPYGIPRYERDYEGDGNAKTVVQTLNSSGSDLNTASIEKALVVLKDIYENKDLQVIFCPERYTSGILLLSTSEKICNKVKKSLRRSVAEQQPNQTYWAVTLGSPVPDATAKKVGIALKYIDKLNKIPIIKEQFSKNSVVERGEVKANVVEHKVLAHHRENEVSLVEINVLHNKMHFNRVWMAHSYSPVLGDLVCGGRVKSVMGKKVKVSLNNQTFYNPPNLLPQILKKLDLREEQIEMIPCHLHLAKLKLLNVDGKKEIILTASPPEHFMWTAMQLGLMAEEVSPEQNLLCFDSATEKYTEEGIEEELK